MSGQGPRERPAPASISVGTPAIAQGGYGSRGNLELVVPHPSEGFTVCWFNSDPPEGPVSEPSIPAATWSAGLHVDAGMATALAVRQVRSGPRFVEVAASGPAGLERWTWSPEDAFTRTAAWDIGPGLPFLAETADELVLGQAHGSRVVRYRSALTGYPSMAGDAWRTEHLHVDGDAVAVAADRTGTTLVVIDTEPHLTLVRWSAEGSVHLVALDLPHGAVVAIATDPELILGVSGERMTALRDDRAGRLRQVAPWAGPVESLACGWSVMGPERRLEIVSQHAGALRHHRWDVTGDLTPWAAAGSSCC